MVEFAGSRSSTLAVHLVRVRVTVKVRVRVRVRVKVRISLGFLGLVGAINKRLRHSETKTMTTGRISSLDA